MIETIFRGPITWLQVIGCIDLIVVIGIVIWTFYLVFKKWDAKYFMFLFFTIIVGVFPVICFTIDHDNKVTYNNVSQLYNDLNEKIIIIQEYNKAIEVTKNNIIIDQCNRIVNSYNDMQEIYINGINRNTYMNGKEVLASYPKIFYNYEQNTFTFENGSEIQVSNWKGI